MPIQPRAKRYIDNLVVRHPAFYTDTGGPGWFAELQYPVQARLGVRYSYHLQRDVYVQLNAIFLSSMAGEVERKDVLRIFEDGGFGRELVISLFRRHLNKPHLTIAVLEFPSARMAEEAILFANENWHLFKSDAFRARYSEINATGALAGSTKNILLVREEFALSPPFMSKTTGSICLPMRLTSSQVARQPPSAPRNHQLPTPPASASLPQLPPAPPSTSRTSDDPSWNAVGFSRNAFRGKRKLDEQDSDKGQSDKKRRSDMPHITGAEVRLHKGIKQLDLSVKMSSPPLHSGTLSNYTFGHADPNTSSSSLPPKTPDLPSNTDLAKLVQVCAKYRSPSVSPPAQKKLQVDDSVAEIKPQATQKVTAQHTSLVTRIGTRSADKDRNDRKPHAIDKREDRSSKPNESRHKEAKPAAVPLPSKRDFKAFVHHFSPQTQGATPQPRWVGLSADGTRLFISSTEEGMKQLLDMSSNVPLTTEHNKRSGGLSMEEGEIDEGRLCEDHSRSKTATPISTSDRSSSVIEKYWYIRDLPVDIRHALHIERAWIFTDASLADRWNKGAGRLMWDATAPESRENAGKRASEDEVSIELC